jgi:hypothetical protein
MDDNRAEELIEELKKNRALQEETNALLGAMVDALRTNSQELQELRERLPDSRQ